jgi:hypothetical protein
LLLINAVDDAPIHTASLSPIDALPVHRFRSPFCIIGLSLLGIVSLTGVVVALQHYFTNRIVRGGQEQHLIVRINAPFGSMSLHPGTAPTDVARIESEDAPGQSASYHCGYFIHNQTLGILRIDIGTGEGMISQPPIAMWRANSNLSLASSAQPQSDMGSPIHRFIPQQEFAFQPRAIWSYGVSRWTPLRRFMTVSTDAATIVTPDPESNSDTRIFLNNFLPMDLSADLGFGQSSLDLSGLPIVNMNIETGASKAIIYSNQPNPQVIENCRVSAGLGEECSFTGISNLNAKNFIFQGGVGTYHLGFEGKLTHNLDAFVSVGLGMITIAIPPTAGRVQIFYDDGLLSSYSFSGLSTPHKGYATSPGFKYSNSPILTLHLSSAMGKMSVSYH